MNGAELNELRAGGSTQTDVYADAGTCREMVGA
jgi:hypothetical protein